MDILEKVPINGGNVYSEMLNVFGGCPTICEGKSKKLFCTESANITTCYYHCSVPTYNFCERLR